MLKTVSGKYYYGDNNQCSALSGIHYYNWTNESSNWSASEQDLELEEGVARNCWCQPSEFVFVDGNTINFTNLPYILGNNGGYSPSDCLGVCARWCSKTMLNSSYFRTVIFNLIGNRPSNCSANTIGITWKPENGEENIQNQCSYDGAVTIPDTPSKVGYDFNGWKVNNAQ